MIGDGKTSMRVMHRFPRLLRAANSALWKLGLSWIPAHVYDKRLAACQFPWIEGGYVTETDGFGGIRDKLDKDGKRIYVGGYYDNSDLIALIRRKDVPVSWGPDREHRGGMWRTDNEGNELSAK